MATVTIENVRISYPHLFQAKQIAGQGDPKYSAAFLIKADNPKLPELLRLANAAVASAYPDGKLPHGFKPLPLYKGEEKYPGNPAYAGYYILNSSKAAAQGAPQVVDQNMNKVVDPGKIYPGLVVNVAVSVYTYKQPMAKGVTTGLEAVQIVCDGERLDNKPSAEELFKPLDVVGGAGGAASFNPLG